MSHESGREVRPPEPLPIPVVDNHTHLDMGREGSAPDVEVTLEQARQVGVDRVVQIGCDLGSARWTVEQVNKHRAMLGGIGLHPNEVPRLAEQGRLSEAYAEIADLAQDSRIRVIGETGLDYFRTGDEGHRIQHDAFRWHIDLAKELGKALQIHDRDAHEDTLRILDEQGAPEKTVLHCFSGDAQFAHAALERGYYLSFAGTVTFKSARMLRDALAQVPLERVLVETDAPYLTPSPYRGSSNSPMLIPLTVRAMATVMGVSVAQLGEALSSNAESLYGPW